MKPKGFTLLEVMIALAVFSICAVTFTQQLSLSSQLRYDMIEKQKAVWIAKNELSRLELSGGKLDAQLGQKTLIFLDQRWSVRTKKVTLQDDLYGVEVTVASELMPDSEVIRLHRYFGVLN